MDQGESTTHHTATQVKKKMKRAEGASEEGDDAVAVKRAAVEQVHAELVATVADLEAGMTKVRADMERYNAAHAELAAVVRDVEEATKKTHANWERAFVVCESMLAAPTDVVHFTACGQPFTLAVDTLRKHPESVFAAYVSGKWSVSKEPFELHCDPRIFAHIVRYMLYGTLDTSAMTAEDKRLLKHEADHFVLGDLSEMLDPQGASSGTTSWVITHPFKDAISEDGKCLQFRGDLKADEICARGTVGWTGRGVYEWSVTGGNRPGILIGVIWGGDIHATKRRKNEGRFRVMYTSNTAIRTRDGSEGAKVIENAMFASDHSDRVLSVRLDLDAGTVTFGMDGVWAAVPSFTGLDRTEKWYPYFDLFHKGSKLTLRN